MRMTVLALAAVLVAGPADAGEAILPDQIIDAASGDWNEDGRTDFALLAVTNEDDKQIGLYIYFRDDRDPDYGVLMPVLSLPDKIWGDVALQGREPTIAALDNGSIGITERNLSVGRDRWEVTRTLAWREGRFVVAGYAMNYFDTSQEHEPVNCDLDLLTGEGIVNDAPVTFNPVVFRIDDWTSEAGEDPGNRICRKK